MNVYIVMDWDGECYVVDSVYSTRKKAQEYMENREAKIRLKAGFDPIFSMQIRTFQVE